MLLSLENCETAEFVFDMEKTESHHPYHFGIFIGVLFLTLRLNIIPSGKKSNQKMVGKAKSVALKAAIYAKQKDDLMAHAVQLYNSQSTDNTQAMGKTLSLRAVCTSVSNDYFTKTNIQIFLSHKTLSQLCQGGTTRTESNKKKSWLMESEQDIIVEYAIDMAHRGFPLSPKRLQEHAEMILRARLGKKFPKKGLSKNWATQFITKHHEKLGTYWSSSLDSS